jgi:hypothetical protein
LPDLFIRYAHDPVCNSAKIRIPHFEIRNPELVTQDFGEPTASRNLRAKNKTSASSLARVFLFDRPIRKAKSLRDNFCPILKFCLILLFL